MSNPEYMGRIVNVGEVIEPVDAKSLGDAVLSIFDEYIHLDDRPYTERGVIAIGRSHEAHSRLGNEKNMVAELGTTHTETVIAVKRRFEEIIDEQTDDEGLRAEASLFVGSPGGGDWHIDPERQHRMLVNLSQSTLTLRTAKTWNATDFDFHFGDLAYRPALPPKFDEITYAPGEGVFVNNMCGELGRVPHSGVDAPGKVFLRLFADPI